MKPRASRAHAVDRRDAERARRARVATAADEPRLVASQAVSPGAERVLLHQRHARVRALERLARDTAPHLDARARYSRRRLFRDAADRAHEPLAIGARAEAEIDLHLRE